jgi:hypothetical protein
MRCHGVFPAKDLAGVGRLLLDGCGIRSAGGRAALKNLNTVSFLMKRFNKIYLIDSMTKFQNGKQPQVNLQGEQGPFLHGTAPADTAAGPSPGFMLAATAENV